VIVTCDEGRAEMSTVETAVGRFVWHDHISKDPEAAQRFYTELLGWELESFPTGDFDYPMIKAHDQTHGGFGPAQGDAPPSWLGHVIVDDVDAAAGRAEAAGGRRLAEPMDIPDVGRMVAIADPQGAVVSLFKPADQAPSSEGVFVWDELHTTDVDAAKTFYTEVVGWDARDMDMGEGVIYTMFSSDGVDRGGASPQSPEDKAPPNWLAYVYTDDVDSTVERAEGLGATRVMGPVDVPTVGRLAVLVDPTGAAIGLFKPSES